MTTDENIMKEMLDRATNSSRETVDELSLQMFCMVVRSNAELVNKAHEMIISKIRSNDVIEATRAINLLEECMTKGGSEFQDETAKFRFLNQLIQLVSNKYEAAKTQTAIKQRIMECLLLWTTEFPQREKIRQVYDMLRKEGGVEHGNTPAAVAKRESVLGIDEEMLSKLIKSKDPENYKRANLLIQYRVNQEARRNELALQQNDILREVENTVNLLNQMLETYEAEEQQEDCNSETVNLMRELYMLCKKHKPVLERLPELMENVNESSLIADTIEANESLQNVMKRYKDIVVHANKNITTTSANVSSIPVTPVKNTNTDLLPGLGGEMLIENPTPTAIKSNPLDELSDIFSKENALPQANLNKVFDDWNLLEPISVLTPVGSASATSDNVNGDANVTEQRAFRELPAIDKLSEKLFEENLATNIRVGSFKKDLEKLTLNDLAKEKTQPKPPKTLTAVTPIKLSQTSIDIEQTIIATSRKQDDDLVLSLDIGVVDNVSSNAPIVADKQAILSVPETSTKHLSEITIDLDDVVPSSTLDERVLMDDDVQLTLSFTENRPSRHVSVIVISASNKSKVPVHDFQFEASVRKPCKVRLLPATDNTMPPHKPFRPAAPINQVMLLLNPTGKEVDVTCIVGYKLGDDPDAIKESIVVKDIPYVE